MEIVLSAVIEMVSLAFVNAIAWCQEDNKPIVEWMMTQNSSTNMYVSLPQCVKQSTHYHDNVFVQKKPKSISRECISI